MTFALILGQVDKVDPTFLHQAMLLFAGLLGGGLAATGIYSNMTRRAREIHPQPLQVQAVAASVTEEKFEAANHEISRRLDTQDKQITELWNLVRNEHVAIRAEMSHGFQSIDRALGRIEGKLEKT